MKSAWVTLPFALLACETPTELGNNLQDLRKIEVRYAEIPLESGMIRVDSINTTNQGFLAVGRVEDPIFGNIEAKSFSNVIFQRGVLLRDSAILDSIVIQIPYNSIYTGSSNPQVEFQIHEMAVPFGLDSTYTTKSDIEKGGLLGSKIVSINTTAGSDTARITLDNLNLSKLLAFVKTGGVDSAQSYFNRTVTNGISISAGSNTNAIVNIDNSTNGASILLYFKYPSQSASSVYRFFLNYATSNDRNIKGFVKVSVDRSNSLLSDADLLGEKTPFNVNNTHVYLQSITGIKPYIDLIPLRSFLDTVPSLIVNRADIVIKDSATPTGIVYSTKSPRFILLWMDSSGEYSYGRALQIPRVDPTGSISQQVFERTTSGNYFNEVGSTVQAIYDGLITKNRLVISNSRLFGQSQFYFPNNNFNRLEIPKENITLRLYYTVPKNQ